MTVEQRYRRLWKPLVFVAALTPALLLLAGALGVGGRRLGPDPVEDLLLTCGKTTLNLLWITLAVTPLAHLLHRPQLLRLRRTLGLFVFFYALLHFGIYLVLDRSLDVAMITGDIVKRPYITIGFTALVLLVPLGMAVAGMSVGNGRHAYGTGIGQLLVLVGIALTGTCWVWAGRIMRLPDERRVFTS